MTGAEGGGEGPGEIVLVRHGETAWSREGRHTGRTDVPLTPAGEAAAAAVAPLVRGRRFALVLASPLERARRTAELAGLTPHLDADLVEWDYGGYEGRTTAEIRAQLGHPWSVFADGVVPGATPGETVEEVAARASRVLARIETALAAGDVALVAHGHLLRILTAVYLRQEVRFAAQLPLDAGAVSVLGHEREVRAIRSWNLVPAPPVVDTQVG
ncbi:MAG: histidine phosphatase family protein [Tetrasphaera sp.]|jgi:broad specificity phosphatase PhoE|nr:histidine phosphatase family protein [Tetrasphaera sp.]